MQWAEAQTPYRNTLVRRSVRHKKINYDLMNGWLNMQDIEMILNPDNLKAGYIPDKIQHYPIVNSKLSVLRGEESKRVFDFKVVVTNPNAISEIEKTKKGELFQELQNIIQNTSISEDDYNSKLEELNKYYNYEWQDIREIRANALLNHYIKEYNIPALFNEGFMDAMVVAEEIYKCDIIGGEPTIERLNPLRVRAFRSGYSSKFEDADIIILENYVSPSKIIDKYYDVLKPADIKYLELAQQVGSGAQNYDERDNFILRDFGESYAFVGEDGAMAPDFLFTAGDGVMMGNHLFWDSQGNVRELQMYWKSRRKIKEVKSYDPLTGEEVYNFYPETYIIDKDKGEEEKILWINEAWEGTKIGEKIFVNMRPKVVQYSRLSNPSRCHFGIIGSVYNLNEQRPFSLIDMMKPYNYLYDVIHDRLNKALAANWGRLVELDLAQVPPGWDINKWLYYAKTNKLVIKDSFKEGNIGAATGRLAGNFAANSRGVIDASTGNEIQQYVNLLEFIKMEMSEVAGISRQREGQVFNRETVGGVERATLQSSHITEWLFVVHDDVKRRALECFLETAKIALTGGSKKFQHILSDMSSKVIDIDGDEFAESDYGLVVDNSSTTQDLNSKLDVLAQAALQNQKLQFSTIMKLYGSSSIAEKQRLVEQDEASTNASMQQSQQQQLEAQQQLAQMQSQQAELDRIQREEANIRDNETKIIVEQLKQGSEKEDFSVEYDQERKSELLEKIRQFDQKLQFEKDKHKDDVSLRRQQINKSNKSK